MLECKCIRNLVGFAASRPPFVIFTLCLAIFAAGLFSVGYYVQSYGINEDQNTQWKIFMNQLSNKEFCMFGNLTNSFNHATNISTGPTRDSLELTQVHLPIILKISPNSLFFETVENMTHVTSIVQGSELGLRGHMYSHPVNLTFALRKPWSASCDQEKCHGSVFSACVAVSLPKRMIPNDMPQNICNISQVSNMVSMVSYSQCGIDCCSNGVMAKPSVLRYFQPNPLDGPSPMGLNNWNTVNLRLQYSSYFLFVMAITCIVYGMIRGRPSKSLSKSGNGQTA